MDISRAVTAASAAADALARVDVGTCDASLLRDELKRLKIVQSRVEVQIGRLTHEADAAGAFIGTGSRDIAEWLAVQTGTSTRRNRTA